MECGSRFKRRRTHSEWSAHNSNRKSITFILTGNTQICWLLLLSYSHICGQLYLLSDMTCITQVSRGGVLFCCLHVVYYLFGSGSTVALKSLSLLQQWECGPAVASSRHRGRCHTRHRAGPRAQAQIQGAHHHLPRGRGRHECHFPQEEDRDKSRQIEKPPSEGEGRLGSPAGHFFTEGHMRDSSGNQQADMYICAFGKFGVTHINCVNFVVSPKTYLLNCS